MTSAPDETLHRCEHFYSEFPLVSASQSSPPPSAVNAVRAVLGPPSDSSASLSSSPCPALNNESPPYSLTDTHSLPSWSQPPVSLVWFRGHDLRVHDHPALDAAVSTGGPVVAMYILECGAESDGTVIYPRHRATCSTSGYPLPSSLSTISSSSVSECSTDPKSSPSASSLNCDAPNPLHVNDGSKLPELHPAPASSPHTSEPAHSIMPEPISPTADFALGRVPQWYLHHSLLALNQSLSELGITLIIRRVDSATHTVDQVVAVACSLGANAVFWNKRYKPNAYPIDAAVRQRLREHFIFVHDFASETLVTPDVSSCGTFNDFQSYTRFCITSFQRCPPPLPKPPLSPRDVCALARQDICNCLENNESEYLRYSPMPSALSTTLPTVADLGLLDGLDLDGYGAPGDPSTIGCVAAVQTLQRFLAQDTFSRFAVDKARREGMVTGKELATSRLSPHIRFGEISSRVIFYAVVEAGANAAASGNECGLRAARTFLKNMSLREFGYYMLARYPCASRKPIIPEFLVFPWREDPNGTLESAWENGLTGFPIVDAAMRQLCREGWLHNKMRFLVASFYVKYLLLPWPIGAAHLVRTLIDGDEACNSLGWQWTAGTNSDSFPFSNLVNPLSIKGHSRSIHRAAAYVRKYVPELAQLPDRLLFTPWKATVAEREQYKINIVPIQKYFIATSGQPPPMSKITPAQRIHGVLYPARVVDLRDARESSLRAMDLMRRIFSAQKSYYTIAVDQEVFKTPNTSDFQSSTTTKAQVRRRMVQDEDGKPFSELDLTGVDNISTISSDISNGPFPTPSPKKRHSMSRTGSAVSHTSKKRKFNLAVIPPGRHEEGCIEKAVDLLALCEAASRDHVDIPSCSSATQEKLPTVSEDLSDKRPAEPLEPPANTADTHSVLHARGSKSTKRPRRSNSEHRAIGGLSVPSLLSKQSPQSCNNDPEIRVSPVHLHSNPPIKASFGGLPRLAHVASQHGNPEVFECHNGYGVSNSSTGQSTSNAEGMSEFEEPLKNPSPEIKSNLRPLRSLLSTGTRELSSLAEIHVSRSPKFAAPSKNLQQGVETGVETNPGSPPGTLRVPGCVRGFHKSNNNNFFTVDSSTAPNGLDSVAFNVARNAGIGMYNPPLGAMSLIPNVQNMQSIQNPQNLQHHYAPLPPAPPQAHAQHLMMPYRHTTPAMPMTALPTQLSHVHGMGTPGYFGAGTNSTANQVGQTLFWYHPSVPPYMDIRTALPTGAMMPHMMQSIQPVSAIPQANPMSLSYPVPGNVGGPYDASSLTPVMAPGVAPEVRPQPSPKTPQQRELIARKMAAMDYNDETHGGKHWEQWQAIAIHLLNSYEFCEDTDRETSRAYVRLCVLKDELRDANPNGPRVTVNHCKEVFKILDLPVTGEWDRRGHGGVRGPYVYGCCKRDQNAASSSTPTRAHRNGNR